MDKYFVAIVQDDDPEDPMEYSDYKLISFNTNHSKFGDPAEHFSPEKFRKMQEEELAFILSYYEHGPGTGLWQLKDAPHIPGSDCEWDSVQQAGILFYTGDTENAPPKEKRFDVARGVVATYSDFLRGNVYCYDIEDEDGNIVDSCCGIFDMDYAKEALSKAMDPEHSYELDPSDRNLLDDVPKPAEREVVA